MAIPTHILSGALTLSVGLRRFLALLLGVLVMLSAVETAAWALFEISWAASTEIQGMLLATFSLLAAAYGVERGFHLGVDWWVRRLPTVSRLWVERGVALWTAGLGGLLAFYGWGLVRQVSNTLPATGWPASVGYLPAVAGGLGMVLFGLLRLVQPRPDALSVPVDDKDDR